MNVDNLTEDQIRSLEAQIKNHNYGPSGVHPDRVTYDNMTEDQIRSLEAQIKNHNYGPSGVHPDRVTYDNMTEDQITILEAQVTAQRKEDAPYKEYLTNLINNPNISDNKQFEEAVIQSMKSNGIIKEFTSALVEEISRLTYEFKNIDKANLEKIENQKQRIENLITIYIKYLYEIKKQDFHFYTEGNYMSIELITSDIIEDLWQVQKSFNITFNMPIPKDLGEYYGQEFERKGKLTPGITLMYDDLKNKEVNWHQVLIYKENELTPKQRYLQRQEEKRKAFEIARTEEIQKNLIEQKQSIEQNNTAKGK